MQISLNRTLRRLTLSACAIAALAAPQAAGAVTADLHVEAGGQALATSQSFVTDTTSISTDRTKPACGGTGATKTITGATALGTLVDASKALSELQPLRVSDKFSFGLLVCGVGEFVASDSAFWLYKVNHVSPEVGGDAFKVADGDDVLWYFQDTAKGQNVGDELVIQGPVRIKAGEPFPVAVSAFGFNGARKPAVGAKVFFPGGSATTDANGRATITLTDPGFAPLRAGRGSDIPSDVVKVCVGAELGDCAPERGRRLYGTTGADRLRGGPGRDVITAGAGDDRVNVRRGRRDRVRCGPGRDVARLSRGDRAARDCEVVFRGTRRIRG